MEDLLKLREDIDRIDKEIVKLYEQRMEVSKQVADYKISTGKPVLDRQREKEKIEKVMQLASDDFNKHGVEELFEQIMSMSRKKQYQLLREHGLVENMDFEVLPELVFTNKKVVFQGVEGAYSQLAMKEYFGQDCSSYNVETWKDAMEAIKSGEADYAVLPIENSSAGIVSENYDLLVEYDNYIVAEQLLKIDHCLLGVEGAEISDIKTVYSHPQALMQCNAYLEKHRDWERISVKNTALSSLKVKEDRDKSQAAIASSISGCIYGLQTLDSAIQDNQNNWTRFIIVTKKRICLKDSNRISLCVEIPHESGALYHALSHFIYNNVNMTHIQSRPISGRTWEYRFFIDFEGRFSDDAVANALKGLKEETVSMKILGTYKS